MVLMAILGNLGSGKTLSLTYLAWRNYCRGVSVYSNYALKIPYTPVKSVNDVLGMKDCFFAGDELWSWLDSRTSMKKRNMVVGNFLLTSRKKGINFAFTTQSFGQVDVRIRRVCDFIALPQMSSNERICKLTIFTYPTLQPFKFYKFKTEPIFSLYNTNEIVNALPDEDEAMDIYRRLTDEKTRQEWKKAHPEGDEHDIDDDEDLDDEED